MNLRFQKKQPDKNTPLFCPLVSTINNEILIQTEKKHILKCRTYYTSR